MTDQFAKIQHALILIAVLSIAMTSPVARADSLPEDIKWLTNLDDPVYASPDARKGGTLKHSFLSFPLTFRVVGPDSNSTFRSAILDNQLSLIDIHPNTDNVIPQIATHWAYGNDKRSMYFKLDPNARWSDGHPVTADDFAFTIEFMRSEHIVAPWYNEYYTNQIEKVIIFDAHTLAVISTKATPDLHLKLGIQPTPRHFYKELDQDFVKKYNWSIVPNTGAYQISDFKKGKYVKFKRKKNWWARDLHYFKNRFNVDTVIYTVIRDQNLMWEHFKKGKLDTFMLTFPKYWHVKSKTPVVEKGYVHRIWFFNDMQQPAWGLWLNQAKEIFKERNLRYAFAHAMNFKKVITNVLRNDYFRLEHGFIGYGKYTNTDIKARRFDLEKVDHYMRSAGWQRGQDGIWKKESKRFSVSVSYGFDGHTPRLVVLKEEAKKAGIELRLQLLDASAEYKKIVEKKHDVAWMGWSTSERPQFWGQFHSINAHKPQTNNITNTADPDLDRMVEDYRNSLDEKERIDLAHQIQRRIHEIGAFVPSFMVPYARQAYWRWLRLPDLAGTRKSDKDLFEPFNSRFGGLFWFDQAVFEATKQAMKKRKALAPVTIVDETYKK
jgi:microcin C transport system substrate-binding protein